MKLFHGTSSDRLGYFEEEGLVNPFLTDLRELAQEAAFLDMSLTHTNPVILKVTVEDASKLMADPAMYRRPMSSVLKALGFKSPADYDKAVARNEIRWPKNSLDWETSLSAVHSVRYMGAIPRSKIEVVFMGV